MELRIGDATGSRLGGPRSRAATAAIVAAAVGMVLLDFVVLKGEHVAHASVRFDSEAPAILELARAGEEYTFEITTRRTRRHRGRREHVGRTVAWRLEDPDGTVVAEGSELTAREERFFDYTPAVAGAHALYVEDNGLVLQSSRGSARIDVYVGDNRIFGRLFSMF